MTIATQPLAAPFGVEVHGFDLAALLDDATRDELVALLDEHLVVVFRNGANPPGNVALGSFCRRIGPLRPTLADRSRFPDEPGINRVSNRDADGVQGTGGAGPVGWHSDLHFQPPLIEFVVPLILISTVDPAGALTNRELIEGFDHSAPGISMIFKFGSVPVIVSVAKPSYTAVPFGEIALH